jgi:N-methylhydantoinase A
MSTTETNRHVRVSIDTGGTFTDIVAIDELDGRVYTTKTPSTPNDPSEALLKGIRKIADRNGFTPGEVSTVVHGTTTATNAVLQRDFGRLGLIVTSGFEHVLEIARQSVPDGYGNSYFWVKPERPVTLERVVGVSGRMGYDGTEFEPLSEEDVHIAAEELSRRGVDCIAVCLLHSYANPAHERRVGELLQHLMPDAFVSLSSIVLPEYREYERAMTTILDVMVKPFTRDYLANAERRIHDEIGEVPFLIMQSNGGVVSAREIGERPITTLLSGPAAGVLAAIYIGRNAGYENLLTLDAGGTSTDVCLIENLQPSLTTETKVDQYPVKTPMLEMVAVGTGGGSIAWVGPQRSLKVGPISAGADPGPICYGRGGTQATITDVNLVLGRIPAALLGGEVPLDAAAAHEGVARIADELGLGVEEAAAGILEIAAWNQSNGIRQISVQKGRDPSDYALVSFGGSGGLLAGQVAEALGIGTVIVPPNPGNVSAFGLQVSDVRRDYVRTIVRGEEDVDVAEIENAWATLENLGREDLTREGVETAKMRLTRTADIRYEGEASECAVRITEGVTGREALDHTFDAFHGEHERIFGFAYRGEQPVEIVNLRVQAIGEVYHPTLRALEAAADGNDGPQEERSVWFGDGWVNAPIYQREKLTQSAEMAGPAIIQEFGSTTVVFPNWSARIDVAGNLLMERIA